MPGRPGALSCRLAALCKRACWILFDGASVSSVICLCMTCIGLKTAMVLRARSRYLFGNVRAWIIFSSSHLALQQQDNGVEPTATDVIV